MRPESGKNRGRKAIRLATAVVLIVGVTLVVSAGISASGANTDDDDDGQNWTGVAMTGPALVAGDIASRGSTTTSGLAAPTESVGTRMKKRHGKYGQRKAISPIIATVLIIAVTLIASVAIGGFVFGIFAQGQNSALVAVTGTSLLAADFTANPAPTTFACVTANPTIPYLTVTNTGSGSAAIASVGITWAGTNNAFSASSTCNIGAAGTTSATSYLDFAGSSDLTATGATAAISGQAYTGTITLTNGAQLLLTGIWQ